MTGVRSRFLSSHIQLQEVLVARCAAKPGFAKMNRASQKVRVASRMHAALCGNIDASTPTTPSGSTPSKHFALLSEQPTQSHHNRGVAVSTRCHTSKNANAGYRDGNRRDKEEESRRAPTTKGLKQRCCCYSFPWISMISGLGRPLLAN